MGEGMKNKLGLKQNKSNTILTIRVTEYLGVILTIKRDEITEIEKYMAKGKL